MKLSFPGADRDVTGTLTRTLVDGVRQAKLFGDDISVRAQRYTINGFSAHADCGELLTWQQALKPARTILVHGEYKALHGFATQRQGTAISMPDKGDEILL